MTKVKIGDRIRLLPTIVEDRCNQIKTPEKLVGQVVVVTGMTQGGNPMIEATNTSYLVDREYVLHTKPTLILLKEK